MYDMTKLSKYFSGNGYQFTTHGENKTGRDFANFANAFKGYLEYLCEELTKHLVYEKELKQEKVLPSDKVSILRFNRNYFDVSAIILYGEQYIEVFTTDVRLNNWENKIVVRILKNDKVRGDGFNNMTTIMNLKSTMASVAVNDALYNICNKYYNRRQLFKIGNNVASLWGGSCKDFKVCKENQRVVFSCIEHGEEFSTTVDFCEIEKYLN